MSFCQRRNKNGTQFVTEGFQWQRRRNLMFIFNNNNNNNNK